MSRPVPDVPIAELNARTEHVKLLDVQVLSDNWYVLRKVTCSLRRRDGQWQTMSREAYAVSYTHLTLPTIYSV